MQVSGPKGSKMVVESDSEEGVASGRENMSPNRGIASIESPNLNKEGGATRQSEVKTEADSGCDKKTPINLEALGAHGDQNSQAQRKCSLVDCDDEMNCEEMKNQEEMDNRCQINQKLIKNKNHFMEFQVTGSTNGQHSAPQEHILSQQSSHIQKSLNYTQRNPRPQVRQSYVMILDKRSRSETPDKMSDTEVFFRAHQKLQQKRKESPSKLQEIQQQKQKKAEELRTQIENTKKKWFDKTRRRQEIAKQKWKELLNQKKRALQEKMELAEERRESEIEILRNKAKQELQKIDETNYIMKMMTKNMELDINNKMSETTERRNQIMEENKRKHQEKHLKEEAAEKRRQYLQKEQESKIFRQKQRREQAQLRRNQMLEQKRLAVQEKLKRNRVLQRKNDIDKISDVMSFVNNSDFLWECLGNEKDWQELGYQDQEEFIFELISKDQLELEKIKLKRDADILNKAIVTDEQGNIVVRREYLPQIQKMSKRRRNQNIYEAESSEGCDSDDCENTVIPYNSGVDSINIAQFSQEESKEALSQLIIGGEQARSAKHHTPKRSKTIEIEESKTDSFHQHCSSDNSGDKEDSVAEEQLQAEQQSEEKSSFLLMSGLLPSHQSNQLLTDEALNLMLYQLRIKMSMKRNILKKSLSEDLTWADFLKNDSSIYGISKNGGGLNAYPNFINQYNNNARSQYSTPERRGGADVASDYEKEDVGEEIAEPINQQIKATKKKKKHHHHQSQKKGASQSSGKHHHSTQNSFVGLQGVASSLPQLTQNTSMSNLSDKNSRISSVVYPSTKKKNPKNEKQLLNQTAHSSNEAPHNVPHLGGILGGLAAYKQKGSHAGSNTSSTQSLLLLHPNINNPAETPRDGFQIGCNFTISQGRKSLILETDSGRKKQCNTARLNTLPGTSSAANAPELSSQSGVIPQNIFNTQLGNPNIQSMVTSLMDVEDRQYFDSQSLHPGTQMNQLLTNSKPLPTLSKTIIKKLTVNAHKFLYPIVAQKLLLKRPGKESQFGKFKVSLKIEELVIQKPQQIQSLPLATASQPLVIVHDQLSKQSEMGSKPEDIDVTSLTEQIVAKDLQKEFGEGQVLTPVNRQRKESTDTNNSASQIPMQNQVPSEFALGTPPNVTSKLLEMHQKFLEKRQQQQSSSLQQQLDQSQNLMKKKNALIGTQETNVLMQQSVEATPSPKKDSSQLKQPSKFVQEDVILPTQSSAKDTAEETGTSKTPSTPQNEQGYKEQLVRYLVIDNVANIKLEDTQKTIFLEGEEANKLIDHLELNEIQIRYCRLCECIIQDSTTNEAHVQSKVHKRVRDDLQIKDYEDYSLSVIAIHSAPGDIEKELQKEKEKALKRKVKRIKAQMIAQAVSHEAAASCPGKDFLSTNKKRCQILCIELEKQVVPIIKDYEALENSLKEIIKILDMRKQADLHLMRKLKFIPILIDICKRILVCHKNEFKHLGRVLEFVIKIITTFCALRENRNYMLQTNRMSALIELLNWCLNRPTQLFYGINFVPQLFHILSLHVKHRTPYECQQMKELFIEYLISSQITMKIKGKFQIINGPLDLSEMMGQVPLFLLKSATFLESLTSLISMDAISRPVYEKTEKIADHVFFVIQNTELFGVVQMIATILLTRNQPFKPSQNFQTSQQKILPQTILSLAISSIKIINNVYRMDYRFAQQIMSDFEVVEQLYHLFNQILYYSVETADKQEDSKELLHETILLIGYFCLNNEKNQALLCRGESTIIQKLCGLPIAYFHDKKLKDILFPTLIQASYKNERCLAIMDQEISIDMLVNFIQANSKEELSRIIEEENDYQSMSSLSQSAAALERRSHRSPSISSTNSSQCSMQIDMINGNSPFVPLVMRFPKKLWKDAIQFYSSVLY